ncbi:MULTISPECIES: hypothetical protein [unclassified Streptomyces]|uniref:hypothetical protein n=1 Tax=unclassified Streptomyces TaxID=2593676 RepID=UPI00331756CF
MTVRPLSGADELGLFCRLSYVLGHELADDLATGRRVPEWMWVALDGERVVARAAWWTDAAGNKPLALDFFDLDDALPAPERVAVGVRLLETAAVLPAGAERPGIRAVVPPDWHEDPVARDVVGARIRVMEETGARMLVERLRLEWRAGPPVPEDSGRLVFRAVAGREELLALMAPVMEGTLSASAVRRCGAGAAARGERRGPGRTAGEVRRISVDGGHGGRLRSAPTSAPVVEGGEIVRRNSGTNTRSTSPSRSRPVRRAVSDLV